MKRLTKDQWLRLFLAVALLGGVVYLGWPRVPGTKTTAGGLEVHPAPPPKVVSDRAAVDKGLAILATGDRAHLERAIDLFRQALRRDPTDWRAHFGMGWVNQMMDRPQMAESEYHTAAGLAYNKDQETAYYAHHNLAVLYQGQNEPRLAIQEFHAATEFREDWTDYFHLGQCLTAVGNPKAALPMLDHALKLHPNDAVIYFELGAAQWALGNKSRAAVEFNEAMRRDRKFVPEVHRIVDAPARKTPSIKTVNR